LGKALGSNQPNRHYYLLKFFDNSAKNQQQNLNLQLRNEFTITVLIAFCV